MSYRSQLSGATVYRPDKVTVPKHMIIDPTAKPMDEVWRFVRTCCQVFLAKWRVWSYRKEDIDELEQNVYMHCYFLLVWRVRHGKYNRQYSFYHNVRSCAMSTVSSEIRAWLPRIKDKLNLVNIEKTVEGTETLRLIDTLSERPQWKTPGETKEICNGRRYRGLPDKVTQKNAPTLRRYIDADYAAYIDDCEEFGIVERLTLKQYIQSNYSDEEYQIYYTNTDTVEYRRAYKARCREAMRRLRAKKKTAT